MFRLILLIATTLGLAACHKHVDPRGIETIDDLDWLAGSWSTEQDGVTSEEHWTAPAGGTMLGMNRTIKEGRTVFFEYLRIEQREDGVYYLASPRGRQPPTEFKLVAGIYYLVHFKNPNHDFPQRITYSRLGHDDELHATVEGVENDQARRETWVWKRMKRRRAGASALFPSSKRSESVQD